MLASKTIRVYCKDMNQMPPEMISDLCHYKLIVKPLLIGNINSKNKYLPTVCLPKILVIKNSKILTLPKQTVKLL